jgi:hypothetical protein
MTEPCHCQRPPFKYADFESRNLGVDEAQGRFAQVSVEQCKACGQQWLRYFFEFEVYSQSGRWYRASISDVEAESVTESTALTLMSRQGVHFRGGSYFGSTGSRCDWALDIDHL